MLIHKNAMDKRTTLMNIEPEDEIVISGIAGRFPESDNMKQLQDNLFNKVDLSSDDERLCSHYNPGVPKRTGKVNNIEKFDAEYFDISFKDANLMDPMSRMLLEHTYEAIVDAGINPKDLRGTRTGVFIATCYSETQKALLYERCKVAGDALLGCSKSIFATRISYWLDITGPSYVLDTACSSGFSALEKACRCIRSGECGAAIVCGSNLCLHPNLTLQFAQLGLLAIDGFCKPFDVNANGYMRSETVAAIYLQKAKDAKRVYATLVHAKTNCDGFKEEGITFPSSKMQTALLQEFYDECGISPSYLNYIEAHGTGTKVGDPVEVETIDTIFCKDRHTPLLIGSVKSNMGHSEPASGLCQIAKVLIAMETGTIPPNINFKELRKDIKAFKEGRIQVVTDPTPWDPSLVGINSFGFGGTNYHILLRPNIKRKINGGTPNDELPRLVVISGRTEQAVESFLNDIESQPLDVEYVRLLHDLHADDIKGHPYRGYVIIDSKVSSKAIKEVQHYSGVRKPICFVFSGIGSQWSGMGEALLRFPAFFETVEKCDMILRKRGICIIDILTSKDKAVFNNIMNTLVGITVMQLGLIDLLASINIVPDYVIGHSIGELCCGYITGNFTIEQVILSAYYIGLALNETEIVHGAMVDIGLNYEKVKKICPSDIEVICSGSPNICSISGTKESVKAFIRKLQMNKIFTKVINCSNCPLHSSYIAPAKAAISNYLNQIIPEKVKDSQIWRTLFNNSERISYAEYFTNNLLSPSLFEKVAGLIPGNTLNIEIAPDGILQGAMNDIFSSTNIVLVQRNHEDNVKLFMQGVGKMYDNGLQPQLAELYPAVKFPVSRGTPMISPSIKWKHSEDLYVVSFTMLRKIISGERVVEIKIVNEDYAYMAGHVIDGKNLLPATGYLFFIWETVGMLRGQLYTEVPIIFEDVKFLRATLLPTQGSVELTLMLQKAMGKFEIIEGGNAIVTGTVRVPSNPAQEMTTIHCQQENYNEEEVMKTRDIYKELRLRGYQYSDVFQCIRSSSISGRQGHIAWMDSWVAFMENMLQMKIFGKDTRDLYVPTGIRRLSIDVMLHAEYIRNIAAEDKLLAVRVHRDLDTIISGGIEISGIQASPISRRRSTSYPILEEYRFVAHRDAAAVSLQEGVILSMHIVLEYHQMINVNIIELVDDNDEVTVEHLASPLFVEILNNLPLIRPSVNLITRIDRFNGITISPQITVSQSKQFSKDDNAILVAGFNLLTKEKSETLKEVLVSLKDDGFLLTREQSLTRNEHIDVELYNLATVLEKRTDKEDIILLKKKGQSTKKTEVICVNNYEFSWVEELKTALNAKYESGITNRIIIVGERDTDCGLLGLVNCLRKEPGGELIRGMLIQDETAPKFSVYEPLYAEQLQTDLILNVLRPGRIWGSYRHLPLKPLKPKHVYHAFANQMVRGDMNSFRWNEGAIKSDYQHDDLIHIIYASLNFKDVMMASGKLILNDFTSRKQREECYVGFEYVGIDGAGRRVMGINENRCISNMCVADKNLCWNVPDEWTLEDAATIPCIYGTCCYALYFYGKMKKGDKILIHSGTGGIGQAAIHLALHEGCEIFTTVGNLEKRKFITDTFPSISEDHIGNSRDTSFEYMILQQTNGRGVDIVLNSLAEEKLQASVRCLARGGRFLEIGKFDFMANNILDLSIFTRGIRFYSVMLDNLIFATELERALLHTILAEALDNGVIKPINRKVFQKDEVETAFRYMAAGKHIGKVIIKVHENEKPATAPILAFPRYYCLANKTYVLLGGLGGIGLELADWLITRGAENIMLISRTGIKNGYQQMKIEQWKSYGVKVSIISNVHVSEVKDCERILRSAEELAPVDAIFNLAVALNDKIFSNHTTTTFQEPFKAKAWATKNLDLLSREICPQLRHFVIFSSVTCGRGNAGQSNYGMANSIMERICEKRSQQGLHGLVIQWGAIGDVGILTDTMDSDKEIVISGTSQQKITSCIEKLEEFLLQNQPIVSSMVVAEKRSNAFGAMSIVESVANIMNLKDLNTVARNVPFSELGMDSMMAVEIKQTLEREFDVLHTVKAIRNLNFAKLFEISDKDTQNEERSKYTLDATEFTGIWLLLRVVGNDDTISDVCIDLPTKRNKEKSEVFLLPGIDGCAHIFKPLIHKIEAAATCLQHGTCNIGTNCTSIIEITNCLFEHILDKTKMGQDFVIVGYSFGTLIAIELARKLEGMKIQSRLVLIDGAPDQAKALSNQYLPFATINELQNNVLLSMMDVLLPASTGDFLLELDKLADWDEKLEKFLNHLPSTYAKLSAKNTRDLCTTVYKRVIAIHEYDITGLPKIKSPVILLKPTVQSISFPEEDYGLRKITEGNVEVLDIEGNHVSMLDTDKVIAVINGERVENIKKLQSPMIK